MVMRSNPFQPTNPVPRELLVGRESEIGQIFDQIANRSHLAIYGSSGMGKSSLLRYVSSAAQAWQNRGLNYSEALIVELNCQGIRPFTPSALWREVLSLLKDKIERETALQKVIEKVLQQDTIETSDLRLVFREIGKQAKFLLLLLDDFDVALHPNPHYSQEEMLGFLYQFRDLAVHREESRYLSTIVTTFRRLNELGPQLDFAGSPWYNHYLFQLLKPFSQKEAVSLFFREGSPLYIPVPLKLRPAILKIAGGHPALLQNAGHILHYSLKDGKIIDVDQFIRDFQSQTMHFFRDTWRFSTEIEQVLLMLIALANLEGRLNDRSYAISDLDRIFSQRQRELLDLEERGIIQSTEEQGKRSYYFASSMMEWWVLQELENSDKEQIKQRQKVFLQLMSRRQITQFKKATQELWKHRKAVQAILDILRKLFLSV